MKFSKTAIAIASLLVSSSALAVKYKVTELSVTPNHKQSFGVANNDVGDVLSLAREGINYPFYFNDYLLNSSSTLLLNCGVTQEELDSEAFDAASADCLVTQLGSSSTYRYNSNYQKIGDDKTAYYGQNIEQGILNVVDVIDPVLGEYTRSNIEQLKAINNSSIAVGTVTAPYSMETYTFESDSGNTTYDLFVREHDERAVVTDGENVTLIEPSYSTYGGKSFASNISDTGYVSGYESVAMYSIYEQEIADNCTGESFPANVCQWSYTSLEDIYELRATVWKVDSDNQVVDQVNYGLAFVPSETQTRNYKSVATSVNDQGIAVGYGDVPIGNSTTTISSTSMPLVFKDGEVQKILQDNDNFDAGYAIDINNSNIVVGKVQKYFDGQFNDSMFVYDLDMDKLTLPTVFYIGSRATANAINDNGFVVGNGEYEISNASTRRKHGYIYDTNTNTFNDLNDFTSCDATLEIIDAVDINNNNEIVATALKTVQSIDALGNVEVDDDGNDIMVQVPVAVLLEPIAGGEIESCADEVVKYERKGFSNSLWMISFLSIFAVIRRRFL
ncbi:DUF3466 family protein [Psychrosphaera haliotis]|uniref:DUF3466 family protein n=1 Tax=Psychrosphaera haliotis TaxID=555083 RepID=UPI0031D8BF44